MLDKSYYNTILCQTYSPCGKYLLAGSIYGEVAIFDLEKLDCKESREKFTVEADVQICSLATSKKYLIVGSVGEITGWLWKAILKGKVSKPNWTIKIPTKKGTIDRSVDVNSLWLDPDSECLYAGCGDNNIYSFNVEQTKLLNTFEGHSDYLHSVSGTGHQMISASQDGSVKLWDSRQEAAHSTIEPHKSDQLARPEIGKWIGSADLGDDWIVCGGGPRLSLWHLRSLESVKTFDVPDRGIHVSYFLEDGIVAGGTAPHLYRLSYSGETVAEIPVSCTTVYSAVARTGPHKFLAIAGSSPKIDVCMTFNYRDETLSFR